MTGGSNCSERSGGVLLLPVRPALLVGGANPRLLLERLRQQKANLLCATPGRLLQLLRLKAAKQQHQEKRPKSLGALQLHRLAFASGKKGDRFLELIELLQRCLSTAEGGKGSPQLMLASATLGAAPQAILKGLGRSAAVLAAPVSVPAALATNALPSNLLHLALYVHQANKVALLLRLLQAEPLNKRCIIFCRSPKAAVFLHRALSVRLRAKCILLEGDADGTTRRAAVAAMQEVAPVSGAASRGTAAVLVASETAARGLDFPLLTHVINFDLPNASDVQLDYGGGREGGEETEFFPLLTLQTPCL
ncbi:hypothetical protein cyc_05709 [Cyclospora cayetanensis]|uniref:RNA helicase n=1 Tax=Cyclospora cayetanensis TaxID=88456 RepID=A0A1D3CYY7_9EIME|nr:hypothetical protein cyc_05709 [Cyclospora cayetanensis]